MSRRKPVSPRPSFSRSSSRSPFLLLSRSSFRSPFLLRPAAVVLALASLPWAAHAQETVQMGTIHVTGKARLKMDSETAFTASSMRTTTGLSLSPRQTPQSVSVVTQAQMKGQGIHTVEDALNTTTGVNVTRVGSRAVFQSRGFYLEQLEEDGVSTTIGAPGMVGNPWRDPKQQLDPALYDHIEVVRGATGLTQGPGEPGGTLNAVRKKPTNRPRVEAEVLVDRFGTVRTMGDASGPLNEARDLRGRVVTVLEKDRSFRDDVDGKNMLLYAVGDKTLGDGTRITAGGLYQNQHDTPDPYGLPLTAAGTDARLPRDTYLGMDWDKGRYRKKNAFVELDHYLNDDWNLNAKLDWRQTYSVQEYATLAGSGGPGGGISAEGTLPLDGIERYDHFGSQLAFQTNLNGAFEALGRRHEAFVTYSYTRESLDIRNRSQDTDDRSFNVYTFTGHEVARPNWDTYPYQDFSHTHFHTHGLAGGVRINPVDRLHVLIAGRYTHWKRDHIWDYDTRNGQPDTRADTVVHYSKNRFLPYAGITYDLDAVNSLYLNYSTIFKYNANVNAQGGSLPPTVGRNYELGWKGEYDEGRLNTSVALFRVDQDNTAISTGQRLQDGTRRMIFQPMTERSQGLDAEISGDVTPSVKLFAGYTYNKREYMESVGSVVKGSDFNRQTPRHMLRAYGNYRLPGAAHAWTVGLGMRVQSGTTSSWDIASGGYTLWNANVQYALDEHWTFNVAVNNLTDKRYYANHFARANGFNNFYGEPRNVMFTANWRM